MSAPSPQHAKGLALTAFGGLTLTFDIPLIRLADGEPWTDPAAAQFHDACGDAADLASVAFARPNAPSLVPGRSGLVVAAALRPDSVTFMTGVYNTSTANLVFILAFSTMFAALLSWIFLKERPRPATLVDHGRDDRRRPDHRRRFASAPATCLAT